MKPKSTGRVIFPLFVGILIGGSCWQAIHTESSVTPPHVPYMVPYFSAPDKMDLCGEPVPLELLDVKERLDREFTIIVHSHAQVFLWMKRMQRYFPWIEKELDRNSLPADLKYVAIAESDLIPSASSPAGAVGPWQFIRSTAINYGLAQTEGIDERKDFELSTQSAFRYLKDLHSLFRNWTLAIAGYNCGESRIQNELNKQKVNSYYLLKLPNETERYVFRILAIKEVLSHPDKYGYYLPENAGYPVVPVDKVMLILPCSVPIVSVAEWADLTYRQFKELNPAFVSDMVPDGKHWIKVPQNRGKDFQDKAAAFMANYHPNTVHHKVSKGETLSGIAQHYGVSVADLRQWNQLRNDSVKIGQTLKVVR